MNSETTQPSGMQQSQNGSGIRYLRDRDLSERLLYTAFLLLVGVGYLMALVYLYTSHEWHDGKPGLSVQDIVDNYYGNRSGSRLEAAIRGPMASYIQTPDRHVVVEWLQAGAPERDYSTRIHPIFEKTCLKCHLSASGMNVPDFSNYAGLREFTKVDTGESIHTLMKLSHIHLFGISLVALAIGIIFRHAKLLSWLKCTLVLLPFIAVFADILAWFLTKWDPVYAYTVISAGAALGAAWATQIFISLYQMWLPIRRHD